MQRDDVGRGEEVVQVDPAAEVTVVVAAGVVDDTHAERGGPRCHRLADVPHAHDSELLALKTGAEHETDVPRPRLAGTHQPVAFGHPARDVEQQGHGQVGRGVDEHAGGVGGDGAVARDGDDVEVVVADRGIGDHLQSRAGRREHVLVDAVVEHGDDRGGVPDSLAQFLRAQRPVVRRHPHLAHGGQGCQRRGRQRPRDDDLHRTPARIARARRAIG